MIIYAHVHLPVGEEFPSLQAKKNLSIIWRRSVCILFEPLCNKK